MSEQDSMRRLNDREIRVASFIEQHFWLHSAVPTQDVICDTLGENPKYVKSRFEQPAFRQYLITRGINLNPENDHLLTPAQLMFVNMLLNMHDRRTEREKIKELREAGYDISSQKYAAWLKQPAFRNYLRTRAEDMFPAADWKIRQSLVDTAEDGDVSAIRLYFEMTGAYNPKLDVNFNLELIMSKMVEVVEKYVDPQYHEALAADIEAIMEGKPVDMRKPALEAVSRVAM